MNDLKKEKKVKLEINKKNINKSYYVLLVFMVILTSASIYTNVNKDSNVDKVFKEDVAPVFSNVNTSKESKDEKVEIPSEFLSIAKVPVENIISYTYKDGIGMIEVKSNEKIYSMFDGVVENIYLDYCYGYTVVVRYNDKLKCKYSNLSSKTEVNYGQKINAGDLIGKSINYELMDTSYVYVMVNYDNTAYDVIGDIWGE